jgi:PAS domain S-box-containing protein
MERRKAEAALKENERKFRSYVDNSPSAIIVADNNGQYIDVNPAASRITGYSREELLSMNHDDTCPPEEKCNYDKLFQELHENRHLSAELPFIKKDGAPGYWSVDIVSLSQDLYLGVHTDITDRINAEEMLGSATQRLSLATKSAEIGIWEWDIKANTLIWDKKMYEIYGTEPGDFTGEFKYWEERVHPDDYEITLKELEDAVSGVKDFKTEFRIITPDNEIRFLEAHAIVKRDSNGNPLKIIGTNWNITERKMAEEALIYSKIISEDTNRIKSEFMKNVSHELRTPLTAVIGFSDVLLKQESEGLNDSQRKYVEYIHTSGNNLLDLINKILDFSKYEINDIEKLNVKKIALDSLINEIIMLIAKKAADKSISLSFKRKDSIDAFHADEDKLTQIIHNLLENALKFTDQDGSITIETSSHGRMLRISVIDTGIGIDTDNLSKIFTPFLQIDGSIARKYSGTGIGLALSKKFVELHGGKIWVTSETGKGSNFTFEIPIDPHLAD